MQHHFKKVVFQRIPSGFKTGNQITLPDVLANGNSEAALMDALRKKYPGGEIQLKSYQKI